MRSEWKSKEEVGHILGALQPANRLACEVSEITGLRINDVLALKTDDVRKGRFTVCEEKTGKRKTVRLPKDIVDRCIACSGQHYVFEHRTDGRKHRTRQAVFKDLRRVARLFDCKEHITPHSMRKVYAVDMYAKLGDLKKVQKLLNHDSEAVTVVYALADIIDKRKNFTKIRKV